jgi:hypothetical protein
VPRSVPESRSPFTLFETRPGSSGADAHAGLLEKYDLLWFIGAAE